MPPHEKVFTSAPPTPTAKETLDSRVRRLEQILATSGRFNEGTRRQDESASAAALKHFATVLHPMQQLAQEIRSRVGASDWDAADALAVRLLLDTLTAALRSCRVVSDDAASRMQNIERAMKVGHRLLAREARRGEQ